MFFSEDDGAEYGVAGKRVSATPRSLTPDLADYNVKVEYSL